MRWYGVLTAVGAVALAGQGFDCGRPEMEMRRKQMTEDRATAKKLEKATFAAG